MRLLVTLGLGMMPFAAMAQSGQDPTLKVTTLAHHMEEMRELLATTDPTMRDAAIETALADPSSAVRGMAIYRAIGRYDQLPVEFALPPGSEIPNSALPSIVLSRIRWTTDGRSMVAAGLPCGGYRIAGEIMSDRLRLQFQQVCFKGDLSGAVSNQPGTAVRTKAYYQCKAIMTLSQSRDALEGALQCPELPIQIPLSMPLG